MVSPSKMSVPVADPVADNRTLGRELEAAAVRVIAGGPYILGPEARAFEHSLAEMMGGTDAVGVASGTDALALALIGAGIEPGDEVISPSHTAGPTVAAIRMVGATPVLVEIEADNFNISPRAVENAIGRRVKAVIAVHLYGHPADIDALADICDMAGLALIEDCAQAAGATVRARRVGGIGTAGCFSFYPTKNLGAAGDGGAVISSDTVFLESVRALRTYGWKKPQHAELERGRCSRLDELQAAILAIKLPLLDQWNDRRSQVAQRYIEAFADLPLTLPTCQHDRSHVYHLFVLRSDRRDALEKHLRAQGVGAGRHYPLPVHKQPGLANGARIPQPLTLTEQIAGEILSLPIYYAITDEQVDHVINAVRGFYK